MVPTHVVVAVDLSDNSMPAARAAAWLCRELKLAAALTYSIEPETVYGVVENAPDGARVDLAAWAEERLDRLRDSLFSGVEAEPRIVEGAVAASEAICDVVETFGAQLVVMGTHGRTALEHAVFGSTATSVVRHAPCDVLTVRPPPLREEGLDVKLRNWVLTHSSNGGIRRILCPLDFSPGSDNALKRAAGLALRFDAELVLHHAVQYPFWAAREELSLSAERARASAKERLADATDRTRGIGLTVESHVTDGQSSTDILRLADERDVDLIVMGTHGRTGLKRWAVGSVTERTVRISHIPVWTVRLPPG